jgi:CDP-glucose 4,6-dehydratase
MDKMVTKNIFGNFYNGRKVLITGHTGFKGSWLSILLKWLGADVYGYALEPNTVPSLYRLADADRFVSSTIGDIRDYDLLFKALEKHQPEIVIHMAAQPLVRESYRNPRETYEVNVMGTVNLLEAIRNAGSVKAVLNVTTDKCYENKEWHWGYRETDTLGGYDPYSNSKACSELVTSSFRNSYFNSGDSVIHGVALATARAGNVLGGGDWAEDRIIPDFIRAIIRHEKLKIRNPNAVRPWQHVLEPLSGYLLLCEKLCTKGGEFADSWNFGADDLDVKNVEWIAGRICQLWGENASYLIDSSPQPHEAGYLRLDCSKAKAMLGWTPEWNIETTMEMTVSWYKAYLGKADLHQISINQIEQYFKQSKYLF